MAFFKAEGVAVVLQCDSGWLGAVRGYARPGTKDDKWSREGDLASPPIVVLTPEHYNRMYRILKRDIPVTIEVEVRNRIGQTVEKASNVIGEIPGSDLKDEVVMIGAHFDTWHASPNASDNTSGVRRGARGRAHPQGDRASSRAGRSAWRSGAGRSRGCFGSRDYVRKHFGNPKIRVGASRPTRSSRSYFNQDYGAGQFRGIYLQGNEHARPDARQRGWRRFTTWA